MKKCAVCGKRCQVKYCSKKCCVGDLLRYVGETVEEARLRIAKKKK